MSNTIFICLCIILFVSVVSTIADIVLYIINCRINREIERLKK